MKASKEKNDTVTDRLDVIIRLILDREKREDKEITIGDQLAKLESTGLRPSDAAKILGLDLKQPASYRRSAGNKRKGS
jgi:hypothetical protein